MVGCGVGIATALEGREVTLDADSGEALAGVLPTEQLSEDADESLATLQRWRREQSAQPA